MENVMTVKEAHELLGGSVNELYIRAQLKNGNYRGRITKSKRRNTYSISRYWFYDNVLGWPKWKIDEYHLTIKGKYWLSYDPNQSKRKKVSDGTETNVNLGWDKPIY